MNALFASLSTELKQHWASLSGSGVAWIAAITARQEQTEWWLRQVATGTAIIASTLTVIHIIKNWNNKK